MLLLYSLNGNLPLNGNYYLLRGAFLNSIQYLPSDAPKTQDTALLPKRLEPPQVSGQGPCSSHQILFISGQRGHQLNVGANI